MNPWLLIGLNLAHWLGDFTSLSTKQMLAAKATGRPTGPIIEHARIHALGTFLVLYGFSVPQTALVMGTCLMLISHFLIDWAKGRLQGAFARLANPADVRHWMLFGADQLAHQLILILITLLASHGNTP